MELSPGARRLRPATAETAAASAVALESRGLLGLVLLTLAALAGNYYAVPLFFGLDFLAGSIFALLAVQIYGPLWGTAAGAIAASYTFFLWGHPWAAVILTAEALVVGILAPRLRQNLLLADGAFWFLIGMPLVALFYGGVMESGATATLLVMLKQAVNGITNALLASLLLTHTPLRRWLGSSQRRTVPLRQVVFELLVLAVLLPLIGIVVAGTRQDVRKLETDLLARLDQTSVSLESRLASWRQRHVDAVAALATTAAGGGLDGAGLQRDVELLDEAFPELTSVTVSDARGVVVAAHPLRLGDGSSALGVSLAGRPWIEAARASGAPVVSGIVRGEGQRRPPRALITAPIQDRGRIGGFVTGALDVGSLAGLLQLYAPDPAARVTLTDASGLVIASTMPELQPTHPYRPSGELHPLGDGRYHRLPVARGEPSINRWRMSVYGRAVTFGVPPWRLTVELPVAPMQLFLQQRYLQAFAVMLGVCLLALLVSAGVSSWLARPLAHLAEATTGLSERLAGGELPAWPRSRVAEVDSLARNFRRMAGVLEQRFHELTSASGALRERSVELAVANRELESEIAERRRAEWALRLLAEAGAALATSLEPQTTLDRVAECCVPGLADWALVALERLAGQPPLLALAHRDAERRQELRRLAQGAGRIVLDAEAIDQPMLLGDPLDGTAARGDALGTLLRAGGGTSVLLLPLRARGKTVGTMALVRGGEQEFDGQTVAVAEELARRAALALDNAALFVELRDADRRKDEFLAMLAHELRNPLSPVATSLQLLRSAGDSPEVTERALAIMERQIGHIVRLVDDLLDVARITRGRIELQRVALDFRPVVAQAVENMRPRFAARRQELRLENAGEPLPLLADPTRLDQVVTNLLANAAKYTPEGGHVLVRLERQGAAASLRVRDDGIGMLPELLSRVFELFMQSEQALDRSQGGLGIGLTLVRQLVEMHGGTVEARSEGEGKGSEFEVRLPLARGVTVAPATAKSAPAGAAPSRRVLVVDDNVEGAESLAELLRLWGHRVAVAHDGPSGLAIAERERPEVVLLDIGLPGLDGYEVGRRLRASAVTRGATLVAVTGYGEQVHGGRLEEIGFDRLLVKPVRPAELQELLREGVVTHG